MPALVRRLGPVDAAAVIVSNVIGGGILFTPPLIAAAVPSAPLFLAAWLAGGLLALAGAMAYAELAALLVAVMFTYSGWNAAAYVAEEIRDPGRNVPRALALRTGRDPLRR